MQEKERETNPYTSNYQGIFGLCNIGNLVHPLIKYFRQGYESYPRTMILLKQLNDLMPGLIPKLGVSL